MFGHVRSAVSGRCALRLARPLARRAAAARPLAAVNSAEGASSFRRCLSSYPSLATGGGDPAHVPESVPATKLVDFEGKLVLLGLGSIGKGTLPLLLKHIGMDASQVYVLTADDMADAAAEVAGVYGVSTTTGTLTRENFSELLDSTSHKIVVCVRTVEVKCGHVHLLGHHRMEVLRHLARYVGDVPPADRDNIVVV